MTHDGLKIMQELEDAKGFEDLAKMTLAYYHGLIDAGATTEEATLCLFNWNLALLTSNRKPDGED